MVKKYDRLHGGSTPMNVKRVLDAWLIYSALKRLPGFEFPVYRDKGNSFSTELVCKYVYSELKECVDKKWLHHICHNCRSRTVVMDGAAKV